MMNVLNIFKKKREVTLVLGGGSARGMAHIGVLRALERAKVPIHRIIGTSMGALIGAGYAIGVTIDEMEAKASRFKTAKLLDPTLPKMGLLAGGKLEKTIKELLDHKSFEDCRIPFYVVTTDIETGEEVVHHNGDLIKIVRASCSWPAIFNPVIIDGRLLVDGGIKNSVPTRIAHSLNSDYLIAVDVGFCVRHGRIENIFQMILQAFQITGEELNKYQSRDADAIIKIELGDVDQAAFDKSRAIIKMGEEQAEKQLEQIKKDLRI